MGILDKLKRKPKKPMTQKQYESRLRQLEIQEKELLITERQAELRKRTRKAEGPSEGEKTIRGLQGFTDGILGSMMGGGELFNMGEPEKPKKKRRKKKKQKARKPKRKIVYEY